MWSPNGNVEIEWPQSLSLVDGWLVARNCVLGSGTGVPVPFGPPGWAWCRFGSRVRVLGCG